MLSLVEVRVREAAMHSNVRARLSDAVNDAHRGTGSYGYYIDHTGDGTSGDCIYNCDGDIRSAPYEISNVGGKSSTHVDTENSKNVVPVTTYQEEADDDDQYASMDESYRASGLYTELPLYERFISKSERDSADDSDFAGKGKSFPILKPGDVSAAVHAMGRAGDKNLGMSSLKSRIIAIAKRKGWAKYLPKTWQGDSADSKESRSTGTQTRNGVSTRGTQAAGQGAAGAASSRESGGAQQESTSIQLTESAATMETIRLVEAKADYEIKLIAPGKGSSAFYPAEVLKRDGPKVFQAGTHVYLNHPTSAEEAARPEGDVKNLAGVLSTGATYHESHAKGPGLYARMKVFADHAQTVEEKAPHVGMSIRAAGIPESNKRQEGLPILKELTHAESVDVVTRAGAGGMILTEAARPGNQQEVEMTDAQITALVESAVQKAVAAVQAPVKNLESRALKGDAIVAATRVLEPLALNEAAKALVIDSVLRDLPVKEGELDTEKFVSLVAAEARRVAAAVGYGGVVNMGGSAPLTEADEEKHLKEAKKLRKMEKRQFDESAGVFAEIMGSPSAAAIAARGRVA